MISSTDRPPGISVIIPNLNHAERLRKCLASLARQSFPRSQSEIIVVDNGSDDDSVKIAKEAGATVLIIDTPKNPYFARNRGIEKSQFSHIALLDSTCTPEGNYLEALWSESMQLRSDLVAGNIEFELERNPSVAQMVDSLVFMRNKEHQSTRKAYPGGSLFFPMTTFEAIGPFREDMRSGPDGEWTNRAFASDLNVNYSDRAIVWYPAKQWKELLREASRDGKGHGQLMREKGTFSAIRCILEMRPPSPRFLNEVIETRGRPNFNRHKISLWFGMWLFRIYFSAGKLKG